MATMTMKHFDTLEYVKQAKKLGATEELAEFQAKQIEQAIEVAILSAKEEIKSNDLATKNDIKELELKIEQTRSEIHKSKYELVVWVAGLLIASGLIQHFFK